MRDSPYKFHQFIKASCILNSTEQQLFFPARTTEPIAPATLARASTPDPFGFVRRFDLLRSRNRSVASFRKIVRHTSSRSTRPRFPERSQRLRFANSLRGNLPA